MLLIIPVLDPLVGWMDNLDYSAQGMVITFHLLLILFGAQALVWSLPVLAAVVPLALRDRRSLPR